jgi:predicted Zn-dependent protease
MRRSLVLALTMSALALSAPAAFAFDFGNVLEGAKTAAQGLTLSEADELAIGQQVADEVLKETPALDNAPVQAYVKTVGDRLAAVAKTPYTFHFTVIDSDEVNAFAAPSGFVFVTTAALASMKTEAQLAGVLGHEIGHVAHRHGIEAIKKVMLAQGALKAATGDQSELVQRAASIGANLVLKGFDRAAESDADDVGAKYAALAGYDPKGIEEFLTTLSQSGETPIWLMPVASHPRSDDRVTALAYKRPATGAKPFVVKEPYEKNVLAVLKAAGK